MILTPAGNCLGDAMPLNTIPPTKPPPPCCNLFCQHTYCKNVYREEGVILSRICWGPGAPLPFSRPQTHPRPSPHPPSPPQPEIGWKVGGSRRMDRCYAPPVRLLSVMLKCTSTHHLCADCCPDGEQVPSPNELRSFHTSWRGGFKRCTGATPRELGNKLRRIFTTLPGNSPWHAAAHNGARSLVFIAQELSDLETFHACAFLWHCCRHI